MIEPLTIVQNQLVSLSREAIAMAPQLVVALIVIALTFVVSLLVKKVVRYLTGRSKMRESLRTLLINISSIGIWMLGAMVAAIIAFPNLTPAKALAGLGIGSVAIGFAFKDIFENFLAGLIILLRREMRIGDFIECESLEGKVEEILIRETHIRQTDDQLVIVPNAVLFKNPLTIRTDTPLRRITIACGVAYDADLDESRSVIEGAIKDCDSVAAENKPIQVFLSGFGGSSMDFEVSWWTGSTPLEVRQSTDQVVGAIKRALDEAGIEIPFPHRTLTFNSPVPLATEAT